MTRDSAAPSPPAPGPGTTVDGVPDDVVWARAYLSRVAEPANPYLWEFVEQVGPVAAVEAIRTDGVERDVHRVTTARRDSCDPDADLAAAARAGIRLIAPESAQWPHYAFACLEHAGRTRLREIRAGVVPESVRRQGDPIPPLALWVRGDAELRPLVAAPSVGIVGARAATGYGSYHSRRLARDLARGGAAVVSGGAFGIDKAAHLGALDAAGVTVLVSAGGLDRPYPTAHEALFAAVAEQGLLVSESPPGSEPQRRRFVTRNRLIAALSAGVVIVEAQIRSGALNTEAHARRLGRPVMALPGSVDSALSAGCHEILRRSESPAVLVRDADDVAELLGWGAPDEHADSDRRRGPRGRAADRRRLALDALDGNARAVFDAVPAGRAVRTDELVVAAGLPVGEVLRAVPVLQLAGLLDDGPDGVRLR